MKKIIYVCIISMLVSACDLLMEDPSTRLLEGSAFDTENALEAQMTGIYGTLTNSIFFSQHWLYYFNCASQIVHWDGNREGLQFEQGLRGTLFADQTSGRNLMANMYSTINTVNTLLAGLDTSPVDVAYKEKIAGEAYMIRGMMYFYLVRMFGNVPLHIKPMSSDKDAYVKRADFHDVYVRIVSDLNNAFEMMPSADEMSAYNTAVGRPHKYAAKALLAQVYLQIASILHTADFQAFGTLDTGEIRPDFSGKDIGIESAEDAWRLALSCADDVIHCGAYQLEKDYKNLFQWDPESLPNAFFSKEKILAIQMTPNGGTSAASIYTLPAYMVGTLNAITVTHASSQGIVRPSRYVFQRWARTYGGNLTVKGDHSYYTTCNDPRLDATYIYNSYQATADKNGNRYDSPMTIKTYPEEYSGTIQCYFKKYFYPQFDQDAGYADFYVIRLPEMYYIAAEACAQLETQGQLGDAYDYIDYIHARARGELDPGATQSEYPKWIEGRFTKDELITEIFWERVYEMGGEGHEWFDSHRLGAKWLLENVNEPLHDFLQEPEQSSYRNSYGYNRGLSLSLTLDNVRNCLMCDYPKYEILYNQALTSNDQNFYNSYKAGFSVDGGGASNNESYDDEKITLPW